MPGTMPPAANVPVNRFSRRRPRSSPQGCPHSRPPSLMIRVRVGNHVIRWRGAGDHGLVRQIAEAVVRVARAQELLVATALARRFRAS